MNWKDFLKNEITQFLLKKPIFLVASVGILLALLFSFNKGRLADIPYHQINIPSASTYKLWISGLGTVESSSRNINVGSYISGIVDEVFIKEGDEVKAGQPLFALDKRAQLEQVQLDENLVKELEFAVQSYDSYYQYAFEIHKRDKKLNKGIKSEIELKKSESDYQTALADLNVQKSKLAQAVNKLNLSKILLDKHTIKAPIDGSILKTYIKKGEYVKEMMQDQNIIMGSLHPLHVRVQVDENDMWMYKEGSKARAYLRGNSEISYDLEFVRLEPYAAQKKQLSGLNSDRVDTRVVELIYKIKNVDKKSALIVGQVLDVFVERIE